MTAVNPRLYSIYFKQPAPTPAIQFLIHSPYPSRFICTLVYCVAPAVLRGIIPHSRYRQLQSCTFSWLLLYSVGIVLCKAVIIMFSSCHDAHSAESAIFILSFNVFIIGYFDHRNVLITSRTGLSENTHFHFSWAYQYHHRSIQNPSPQIIPRNVHFRLQKPSHGLQTPHLSPKNHPLKFIG